MVEGGEEGARPGTAGSRRRRPSERRRDASARLTPFDPRTRSPVVHSIVSYRVSLVSLCLRSSREKEREREEGGSCSKEGRRGGLILEAAGWRLVDRCNRYVDVFCVLRAMFGVWCMGLGNGMGNGKGRSKFSKRREIDVTGAGCRSERPVALHRFSPFCVVDARILNNLRSRIIRFLS